MTKHNRYADTLKALGYSPATPQVTVQILSADGDCFEAEGKHEQLGEPLLIDCRGLKKAGRLRR